MTVTERDLLEGVLANPDDDEPRLVLADWLAERGDPRGELIHVQCALATMATDDPRRAGITAREEQLLRDHRDAWTAPYRKWNAQVFFRRGFVDEIVIFASTFARAAEEISRSTPLRAIHAQGLTGLEDMRAFAAALRGLREVRVSPGQRLPLTADQLTLLATSEHAMGFVRLQLRACRIDGAGLQALIASTRLGSLQSLDLTDNAIDYRIVYRLAATHNLPSLRRLVLGGNWGARLAAFFHGGPLSNTLLELGLSRVGIDQDPERLGEPSSALRQLRRLDLSRGTNTNRFAEALAAWTEDSEIEDLDLRGNRITDRGGRAFLTSRPLRRLALDGNELDPELLRELAERHR